MTETQKETLLIEIDKNLQSVNKVNEYLKIKLNSGWNEIEKLIEKL